jgi:tetratricopeptide (TPR) repeat protein
MKMGDLVAAKEHFERALEIDKNVFGSDFDKNPEVAVHFSNLSLVLRELNDSEGALEKLEKALEIFQSSLGEDHPKTKITRKKLESLRR